MQQYTFNTFGIIYLSWINIIFLPFHISGLWGIVSNAGLLCNVGPCEWLSIEAYHQLMKVNGYGSMDVILTFLPLVKKERGKDETTKL